MQAEMLELLLSVRNIGNDRKPRDTELERLADKIALHPDFERALEPLAILLAHNPNEHARRVAVMVFLRAGRVPPRVRRLLAHAADSDTSPAVRLDAGRALDVLEATATDLARRD